MTLAVSWRVVDIYLLRHAIAEEGPPAKDSERPITGEGRRKLRAVLETAYNNAAVSPVLIVTSPYRRAVQTAELAAEVFEYGGDILRTKTLLPGASPPDVWEEIRLHKDVDSILLSGHDPLFTSLAGYLLGCPSLQIDFKKATLVRIFIDRFTAEPRGVLKWMLTAKLCREGR
jgi:phosphohistidine phosphatase